MKQLFTRENITLVIALFGAVGTIINALITFFHQRLNLRFELTNLSVIARTFHTYAIITNYSRLPISISSISVRIEDRWFPCSFIPVKMSEHNVKINGQTLPPVETYSTPMPIEIGPLGSFGGLFVFDSFPKDLQLPTIPDSFLIATNRGKVIQKIQSKDDIPDLYHRR